MELSFTRPNGAIDQSIEELINKAEGIHHPKLVREMIISALKAGQETDYLADLKMLNNTMKEMRYTNKVFAPYRHRKKVTIFGSARTTPNEPIYQKCVRFSRRLSEPQRSSGTRSGSLWASAVRTRSRWVMSLG